MISAGDFKNGLTIEFEGELYIILDFQHVKPGKGAAFVRSKIKNLVTGSTLERTFRPTEKMSRAHIDRLDFQYLYNDGDLYHFMDTDSFEQTALNESDIGDALKFVKENDMVKVLSHNGKIFGIEPPTIAELRVVDTDPGFKGDTATGAIKPAKLETGASVNVPLFINIDDIIKVDTRTAEYAGRV